MMQPDERRAVGDLLTREVDAERVAAGWDRVRARRSRPRALRRAIAAAPVVAMAAVLVIVIRAWLTPAVAPPVSTAPTTAVPAASAIAPIALIGGAALPPEWLAQPDARTIELDDGSRLEIGASTHVRNTRGGAPDRVELVIDRGRTVFDVKPGGPRAWVIDAGPVVVRVLGTRFTVARSGDDVTVSVERGKVEVESLGTVRVLTAGQTFASAPAPPARSEPKALASTPEARIAAPPRSSPSPDRATAPAAAEPVVDAMDRADAERRSGQPRAAVATLRALVDDGDRRAPLAAFTIAKINAEDLGDPRSSATWFERAIALGLPGGLDEEAHARAVEGHARAGARAEASRARARYEARFPSGRHLARVREWASSGSD
ncbi:MAG: FecR domain-containing protein [Deltaproteobacteria bacterium]|nr:FecR domain-containing protein [Deltaproteobacteria bacterium]